jgi:glycosyltransferase involved in cell wall biosynthesis
MKTPGSVHVVYIITKLELGGAQKVCLALMRGMNQSDVSCSLISGNQGELIPQVEQFSSVCLLKSLTREVGIKSAFQEIKAFFDIIFQLRKLKAKHPSIVVHTHSTKAGILGRWAAFFAGIKHRVHTVHGYGFHDHQSAIKWFAIVLVEYFSSLITTHFICVSEKDRITGTRLFPFFSKKSSIIRAAIDDVHFFSPAQKDALLIEDSNLFVIGTVSCFKPQKNIFDLLRSFKFVYDNARPVLKKRLLLQIIGDGQLRDKIQSWIVQNKLATHIELLGWQQDVATIMRSWKVFALSSLWEGLPCAVVEARLCGLPVVAYDVGGIAEVVENYKNGFLVPVGQWHEFGEKLLELTNDENLCASMRTHPDLLDPFQQKFMVKEHKKLYSHLVG